jgi:hypothetical protein
MLLEAMLGKRPHISAAASIDTGLLALALLLP